MLKTIEKTLSITFKIAEVADPKKEACFCADLTANPILVEWNKNVAARLAPFSGLGLGLLETTRHQNYKNWKKMISYHSFPDASRRSTDKGVFNLEDYYYQKSSSIFTDSNHYVEMFHH